MILASRQIKTASATNDAIPGFTNNSDDSNAIGFGTFADKIISPSTAHENEVRSTAFQHCKLKYLLYSTVQWAALYSTGHPATTHLTGPTMGPKQGLGPVRTGTVLAHEHTVKRYREHPILTQRL